MIIIAFLFLLITVGVIIVFLKADNKIRKILLSLLLVIIVLTPICFHFSRKGYIAPGLGSFLNLAVPPKDLYDPIAPKEKLTPENRIYQFKILHKYPGNHAIAISFLTEQQKLPNLKDINIRSSLTIMKNNKIILDIAESKANYSYYGGISFVNYKFPKDVNERVGMIATIRISGDIQEFIDKYGNATITIKKASDL